MSILPRFAFSSSNVLSLNTVCISALVYSALFHPYSVLAQSTSLPSVGYFRKYCEDADKEASPKTTVPQLLMQTDCGSYLNGLMDGMKVIGSVPNNKLLFCPPSTGISTDENIRVVRSFLRTSFVEDEMPLRTVVLQAYVRYFPCGN